jgi:hypothetical protein
MGGGKETPRQKMIGMMYLVLMAMLALNVSKSIIDAFVAIEENIQISSQNEHARGLEKLMELEEKYQSGDTPEIKAKAKKLLDYIALIDKETAKQIQYLDALKMEILTEIKEEPAKLKPGAESIIMVGFDKNYPLKPIRMNLAHVTNKDKYDESMRIFGIAKNMKKPEVYACKSPDAKGAKGGIELWNQMNDFRGKVCQLLVESSSSDTAKYKFVDPKVYAFKDLADLQKKVKDGLKKSKINGDDVQDVEKIYKSLTKNEILEDEHEPGGVHWLAKTFNHAPSVAAIASLSALQKEILTARADAVSLIRSRLGGGEYSFNNIIGLAYPETAVLNPGDQFEVTVMMAAFDSDKQPTVKPNNGSVSSIKDGMATLKMTAPASGEMKITGSVGIANKRGEIKEKTYETKIQVATKSGALEMPEYQVLYRGYDNKIIPSASGVVTYDINVSGCSKQPFTVNGKKGYILKPGSGVKSVSVSLSGKDLKGKSIPFGSWTYSVKPFPNPEIKTSSVSKGSGAKITVGLPADSPLKSPAFQVVGVEVLGVDNGQCPGGNIPGNIVAKLKAGKSIGINVTVKNPLTGSTVIIPGALKVTN